MSASPRRTSSKATAKATVDSLYTQIKESNVLLTQAMARQDFRQRLLQWYDKSRRKLPWRGDPPPYDGSDKVSNQLRFASMSRKSKDTGSNSTLTHFFPVKHSSRSTSVKGNADERKDNDIVVLDQEDTEHDTDAESSTTRTRKPTPYETWVSEIMLQQTRVETAIGYFLKWMERFPSIDALADSSIEEVNSMWAGLGYYRRAKNLHEGAKKVKEDGGKLPSDADSLRKIPGIGPYTAGAISSIAFDQPEPVVDGNVIRVFSRICGVGMDASSSDLNKLIWKVAGQMIDEHRPGDFNQALMELGATMCTPSNADCQNCPLKSYCTAHLWSTGSVDTVPVPGEVQIHSLSKQQRSPEVFPVKKKKSVSPTEYIRSVVTVRLSPERKEGLDVLLSQRPKDGLLSEQWEPVSKTLGDSPVSDPNKTSRQQLIQKLLKETAGIDHENILKYVECGKESHVFSHIKHEYYVDLVLVDQANTTLLPNAQWLCIDDPKCLEACGLSTCASKVLHSGLQPLASAAMSIREFKKGSHFTLSKGTLEYLESRAKSSTKGSKKRSRQN